MISEILTFYMVLTNSLGIVKIFQATIQPTHGVARNQLDLLAFTLNRGNKLTSGVAISGYQA